MIAIREAWRAGLLRREHWPRNLAAGLVVGVVALPLAMAFAIASGARPEQGLYTALVAAVLVSLFGGSRVQIAGPTGAFIAILAGVTARYGLDGLQIATFMAGVILLLLGLSRLGTVIRFIPAPVITGFTAGIGVIIFVGQWQPFLGLPEATGEHFHQKALSLLLSLPQLHPATTALSALSLLMLMGVPRVRALRHVPGPLLAMLAATALQMTFHFDGVATIGSAFGGIPRGLPQLSLPQVSLTRVIELLGPAFAIAMLGAIESLLSAIVADRLAGTRHDSNQELIGQGLANLASPLFGGFAATGAIARTATNIRNGGNSPIAGMVHSLFLVLVLVLLAPLAASIPLGALAAILFMTAWNMSEAPHFLAMLRRAPAADAAILLITFLLTVFADLVVAVNIGVVIAMLQFLRRMSSSVAVVRLDPAQFAPQLHGAGLTALPSGTQVYAVEGPLFFGAVSSLEAALPKPGERPSTLILRLQQVPFMDITGLQALEESIRDLHRHGTTVLLCEANSRVLRKLARAGLIRLIGRAAYLGSLSDALSTAANQKSP